MVLVTITCKKITVKIHLIFFRIITSARMKGLALIVLVVVLTIWDVTGSPLEYEQDNLQNTVAEDGYLEIPSWCGIPV